MGDKRIQRGIPRAAVRKWNEESYEAEKRRYDFAVEEFQRLKEQVELERKKREAILAERESESQQESSILDKLTKDIEDAKEPVDNVTKSSVLDSKPMQNSVPTSNSKIDGIGKNIQSFFTSLWMGLVDTFTHPLPTTATPTVYENTQKDIERRQARQELYWTKDAVAAYNISKNKGEVQKYVGDILLNKEKQQYADVVNTYLDNIQDYLQVRKEYESLKGVNTKDAIDRRNQLADRMSTMKKWISDLDESVKIALSYDVMDDSDKYSSITSYEGSIGAPKSTTGSTDNIIKSIQNQYKAILNNPTVSLTEFSTIQLAIDRTKDKYSKYKSKLNEENVIASKKMDEEYTELKAWEDWHTPSAEYRLKEKAALKNYLFDWDTYAYSFPGTLGSSMTFGGIQLLSTALNVGGGIATQSGNPYAVAGGVAATLAGAGLGIVSGMNENAIEVASNYTDAIRDDLDKNELLDTFITKGEQQLKKKGLFYHKDKDDKIEDILNYFARGDIEFNDQRINEIATKHLFGANNLFQNDMMAVSADVAFDTGLNLFMPAGSVARALKIAPVGKVNWYTRGLVGLSKEHPLIGTILRRAGNVKSGVGTEVLDAISPVAGWAYRGGKVAIPQLNKIHAGSEMFAEGMKKGVKKLTSFISDSPATMFKLHTVGKGALTFGGMTMMRGFSEAIEEGKQYKYGERFKSGGFAGKSNSILETLLDDFTTGTTSALAFFGSLFLGIESDSELMSNMRGGFVGGLLNHGTIITAYQQANNTVGEMKVGDLFMQNMMYQRIQERSEMLNGEKFAKYATNPNKVAQMNAAIDRMIDISGQYEERAKTDSSQQYWTREDIETQRDLFNRIVAVANNGYVRNSIENQGIDIDSKRGNALVAMIAYGLNKAATDSGIRRDHIDQFNSLLEQDRLSSDLYGNISSYVENIENLEEDGTLTKEEVEYLKGLYNEFLEQDEKNAPKSNKKLNSRQRRRALIEYKNGRSQRITDKIRRRVENDKNLDAAFAKHYALLKLKNELESIPEDMRSRTHKSQLKSVQYLLDQFMESLSPLQKVMHQVQTEDSLADLGKNRGFFQQMSSAFRTIALDNAAADQDAAFLNGLLGKDTRMVIDTINAADVVRSENDEYRRMMNDVLEDIVEAAKDQTTFEAKRQAIIDNYLNSVRDDYALFEQIRDDFQNAAEYVQQMEDNTLAMLSEHTRTVGENPQPPQPAASYEASARQQARREKRKRWKENKRRRELAWENMNDAWEEPENDQLIRDTYDPVDMDELENESVLDDYMAQYDDAWEEPWWDELVAERQAAQAEEDAFMNQYSANNSVIEGRRQEVLRMMDKYEVGSVIGTVIDGKHVEYAVIGQKYNPHTDELIFAVQRLKMNSTVDKRYNTIWVSESDIKEYSKLGKQVDINFEDHIKSVNGISVGTTYDILITVDGVLTPYADVEVFDIDDQLNVHFKTVEGIPTQLYIDDFKNAITKFKDSIGYLKEYMDESSLMRIAELTNNVIKQLQNSPVINEEAIMNSVAGLYKLYAINKNTVVHSNLVDSFIDNNGVLVRITKASYLIGDMAVDNKIESRRKASIIALFAKNGINNAEHTIRLLEGWYNNTLAQDETEIINELGKPVDAVGEDLHKNKIDLSPYITMAKQGHLGTVEIEHIAHIVSREYDRPAESEQSRINDIIYKIINGEQVEDSPLVDQIGNALRELREKGLHVIYMPVQVFGNEYSYENNLFVIDAMGNVRSLFFPVRSYDYNKLLDKNRTFPETNRQLAQTPVNWDRKAVMTEREWQDKFALYTTSLMLEYGIPGYKGSYQIPIQSKNGIVSVSNEHVVFNKEGIRIRALDKAQLSSELRTITSLLEQATKLLNNNRDVLPFTACMEMIDFCDAAIKTFEPGITTLEDTNSARYYLTLAIDYMSRLIDENTLKLNPAPTFTAPKPSGKANTKAERMLPIIREDVAKTQELIDNIERYTRPGGYMQKQVRDALNAFLMNEAAERYQEKLKYSSEESDKELASRIPQLCQAISNLLGNYPNVIGSNYSVNPNTPRLNDNVLVLTDKNNLQVGDILTMPDFANSAEIELLYGIYDSVNNKVIKLDRKTNVANAGIYAIITYQGKIYSPIQVLPSHYTDQFNTLTADGEAFVDSVVQQQQLGKVIAFDVHRLLPNVNYNGNMVPVTLSSVLHISEQDLQKLTPQSRSIGMCKTDGKVFPLDSTNTSPIVTLNSQTAARNIGGVFYMLPFDFEEYLEGSSVVPVRLLNSKLKEGDINVIIDILKNLKTAFDLNGTLGLDKEYLNQNGITPFTNLQVLLFLSNFEQNELKCRIFINPDGTVKFRNSLNAPFGNNVDPTTLQGQDAIRTFFNNSSPYTFNHVRMLSGKLSNQNDPLYKKLGNYIQNNKFLSISPSLMFDEDDLNMNGEGFYGIGWALRHGRMVTNAGYVYGTSVGITGASITGNNPVGSYNPQPTQMPQPESTPKVDEGLQWLENIINNPSNNEAVATSTVVATDKKLDKEEAINNIRRILGESVPVDIEDKILDVLNSGAEVVGQCFADSIVLSSNAAYGTEYHEAFHRVVELLMPKKERDRLYDIYIKKHPQLKHFGTREVGEHMAESFRMWMTEKPESFKFTWNIIKLFSQIKNWIRAIKRIGGFRLAYAYYKINTGAYANLKPSQENINRFNVVFGNYAAMTVYNSKLDKNVDLKQFTTLSDYNDGIETISRMIINEYLKSDGSIEVSDIDLSENGVRQMSGYSYLVGENKTAANKAFSELFDNWDSIKSEVIDKLKALGLGIRFNKANDKITISKSSFDTPLDSEKELNEEGHTNEGAIAESMEYFSKESYEISRAKKIKDFIKFLLSSIEDTHYVEEGELDIDGKPVDQWIFDVEDGHYIDEEGSPVYYRNGRWECDKQDGKVLVGDQIKFKKHRNIVTNKNVFGFKKYLPFDEVYSRLLADCHGINTISDLISLLQKKSTNDLMYKQVYEKILNAYNNLLYVDKEGFHHDVNNGLWRKIYDSDSGQHVLIKVGEDKRPVQIPEEIALSRDIKFARGGKYFLAMPVDKVDLLYDWNNVAMVVQLFNAISGSKLNYKMVIATREAQSSMTYRVSDTDAGYTARKYSQSWYLSFISNKQKVDTIEHNGVIYHRTKDSLLFNRVHEFFATVTNAFVNPKGPTARTGTFVYNGRTYNVFTNTDVIKRMIVQNFNAIGIAIDKKTFDHLLFSTFGDIGYHGLVRYFSQNADISGKSKGVNFEFFLKSIVNCQKDGVFQAPLESGAFFMKSGVVGQLADAKYSYNTIHKLLTVSAPGGNKYYVMSEKNTITFMTELLSNKDGETVQDFKNCPYYTYVDPLTGIEQSTFVLDNILSGEYKLVFDNFVGFRNEDLRGDKGSDYMKISDPVDLISKITLLEDNNMIFPVMSNKKTYGYIYLVDKNGIKRPLPGIKFISNSNDNTHTAYRVENLPELVANVCDNNAITSGTYSKYSFIFPDEVYDRLISYAMMEYQTVKYGMKLVDELEEHEKVDNLHKPNKKTKQSSAGICRFPRFYGIYKQEVVKDGQGNVSAVNRKFINFNDNNNSDAGNLSIAEDTFFGQHVTNVERRQMINELLMILLEKWLDYLETNGIIKKRQGWRSIENPFLRYESDVLDKNLINSIIVSQQKKIAGKNLSNQEARSLAIVQLLMDAHIKHQISMEEIQRLYLGHPGEFETEYDEKSGRITDDEKALSKRAGGLASTGETNALGVMGLSTEYVCSEMDDYKVSSPQAEEFKQAFDESEHRSTLFNVQVKKIDTILSNMTITTEESENFMMLDRAINDIKDILNGEQTVGLGVLEQEVSELILSDFDKHEDKNTELSRIRTRAKEIICKELHEQQKVLSLDDVKKKLDDQGLLAGVQTRVGAYSQSYEEGINVGDGASYISPKMAKNLLIQLGLFKGPVVKAFEYLEKGISKDILSDAKACSIIMEAMLGTQKYTAYGYRMSHGFPEFYYNKTALFPMFKQLCVTPKLKGIYDLMTKGDEPIDMLMFKSSVKVGSKGSQPMPETLDEFYNFKPNTYKQKFRFLIKQLNTDPKDREKMAMGTQALKVIESILNVYVTDYQRRNADGTLSDTDIVSGSELRDEIMRCRKNIANLQIAKVLEKFFDKSGAKNEREFIKWIRAALTDRDANADMLKALHLNEDGSRRTRLSGMSDGNWVQSIVATLINKDCIDLNLPGNMFIQRSVFGMEGRIIADKYVPSINNGNRLKLVNEQGSMDAAISIDYFVEMFPQIKKMSFKEQRQWLIDRNIIGQNAKALCISYRIPTQAASSISALRFVDVLPIVRDTIVLPEEFTALTGSDFDIDKLFFSFKNLKVLEDGTVTDEFEDGSLEYYQNLLIEDFIMLLQQDRKKVGNISLRSIDNDTELGKSVAKEIMSNANPVDPYDALSLWKQSMIKEQNRTGGEAVGPAALNNSSQNIGRMYDLHLTNIGVVRLLGISDLSSDLDIDSLSVLGMLGAYINGAVDNAKDPWITTVGFNGYTYNLANTLARAGFGRSTLYFTAQPITKELAKIRAYSESTLFRDKLQTPAEVEQDLIREFERDWFLNNQGGISSEAKKILTDMRSSMARFIDLYRPGYISEQQEAQYNTINRSYAIIKAIIGIDHEDPHKKLQGFTRSNGERAEGSIMRDVALMYSANNTIGALRDHTKRYSVDITYKDAFGNDVNENITLSPNEVQMYMYILNRLLDYPARAVSNSVQYTKIDTKKQGKNTSEQYAYLDGYERLKRSSAFDASMLNMLYGSYIDELTIKTIQLHQKLLSDEYIEAMDPMISYFENNWVDEFLKTCGARVNANSVKAAVDGITSYIKYKYIQEYAEQIGVGIKDLFIGENSVYNELNEIKNMILENPTLYKEYVDHDGNINNKLLDSLEPVWIREKDFNDVKNAPKFVEVAFKEEDDGNAINNLRMAWDQMLSDDKHKDIQNFAKRLIIYGFITSGDTGKPGTLFKYVPFSWRYEISKNDGMELSYTEYIDNFIKEGNERHKLNEEEKRKSPIRILSERQNQTIYDEVLLNNWNDPVLVPTIHENKNKKYYKTLTLDSSKNNPDIMIVAEMGIQQNENGVLQHVITGQSIQGSPRIVKVHKEGHTGYNLEDFYFYRLYSHGTSIDEYGNIFTYPIYTLINPRGGVFYGNRILEYMLLQGYGWNDRNEFVDESKLQEVEQIVSLWNQSIKQTDPKLNARELEKQQALTLLTQNTIGYDDGSVLTLLTASMALYDSFRRPARKYVYEKYDTNIEKGKSKILYSNSEISRKEMLSHPRTLYIFTDNTNRTSGSSKVNRDSKYYKKYGDGQNDLFYPSKTRAVARGLDNAMPISTLRFYDSQNGLTGKTGRWTNQDLEEFKGTIDDEFDAIEFEWASGLYDNIVILGESLFGSDISDINETGERSEIYKYLNSKLNGLFTTINGVSNTEQYYYPGKPALNAVPNWQPGSIYYAGVGSTETPEEVLNNMKAVAEELEAEGYILRSGGAEGADMAFSNGVKNQKNKKIYFAEDIIHDVYNTAESAFKILEETHPRVDKVSSSYAKALLARDNYQVFGEHLDSPSAFILCWTKDGAVSYEQTTADTGGTGQAIRVASRKGIPVINMADSNWRQKLDEVLQMNKPQETLEVWYGKNGRGPNANLSNLAERPFVLSDEAANRLDEIFPVKGDAITISQIIRSAMDGKKFHGVEHAFHVVKLAALSIHVREQEHQRRLRKNATQEEIDRNEKLLSAEDRTTLMDNVLYALNKVANAPTNSKAAEYGKERLADIYGIIDSFFKGVWNNEKDMPDPSTGSYKAMGILQVLSFQQNETAAKKLTETGNKRFTHTKDSRWATAFPQILAKTRNYIKSHPTNLNSPIIRTELIIADSSSKQDMDRAAEAVGGVVTTRQHDLKFHFGNPFSYNPNWGIVVGDGTIKDAVKAFDEWLAGTNHQDVEPERRQWILDCINSGMLDDTPLVYYTSNGTDKTGTHAYNYKTFPNHAHILLKYINMHIANPMNFVEHFASPLEAEKTIQSEKNILSNSELAEWNSQGVTNPRILVASEHTDPAFFADQIVDIVEGRKNAAGYGPTANKYTGKDFNALYIITKHDGEPIRKILKTKIPKIIHFSVTGLGGTVWEPRSMPYSKMLDRIEQLIKEGLDPSSVTIRIDPIVPGVTTLQALRDIVSRTAKMGIKRIKFSVCDMYRAKTTLLPNGGKRIRPAAWAPALMRTEQEQGVEAKNALWNTLVQAYGLDPKNPSMLNFYAFPARISSICDFMVSLGEEFGVHLSTCAENISHPKISKEGCLSVAQVNELLGTHIEDKGTANNNYRTFCSCFGGKVDALAYTDDCATICGYCYAGHANDDVSEQKIKETKDEYNILKFDKESLREMGAEVLKHCNKLAGGARIKVNFKKNK